MDERQQDLRDKLSELAALEKANDAAALFDWAGRAWLALEFRDADAMIGLDPIDDDLIEEVDAACVRALQRAGEAGHEEASVAYAKAAWASRDERLATSAAKLVEKAYENPEGLYLMGLFAFNGFGVRADKKASLAWHRKAADKGHAGAMFELYAMLSQGLGGRKNEDEAIAWCHKSAEAGYVRAMANLGAYYATGNGGVPKDEDKSLQWYDRAARAGHGRAAAILGVMHATGAGAPESVEKAKSYFALADESGFDWRDLADASDLDPDDYES
jgi:hypothetical protein